MHTEQHDIAVEASAFFGRGLGFVMLLSEYIGRPELSEDMNGAGRTDRVWFGDVDDIDKDEDSA